MTENKLFDTILIVNESDPYKSELLSIAKKFGIDYAVEDLDEYTLALHLERPVEVTTNPTLKTPPSNEKHHLYLINKFSHRPNTEEDEDDCMKDEDVIIDDEEVYPQFQNVTDEPENIDKKISVDFLKAQLSTKNQMKIRNVFAIISSVAVLVAFILEKLGII